MIQNCSLKDILLKTNYFEDKPSDKQNKHCSSLKEFRFNLESALKYIKKQQQKQISRQNQKKEVSSAGSHKMLNFSSTNTSKFEIKSPSNNNLNQSDRVLKDKNWDNVQVSKFNISGSNSTTINQNEQNSHSKIIPPKNKLFTPQNKLLTPKNNLLPYQNNLFPLENNQFPPQINIFPPENNQFPPQHKQVTSMSQPKRPRILSRKESGSFSEQFKLGKALGKGKFGNVFLCQDIQTKSIYAVKQISMQKVCPKLIQRLIWQVKIQLFVKHQNCLQLYKFYRQSNNLYLILELGQMSLFDLLRQRKFFNERQVAYYIRQTIQAFQYLHDHGVIHRDLKPENIVLINNNVKLADFGWSIYLAQNDKRKTFCGTLDYISPEIVLGSQYDQMVDVWSIGILCYELSTGHAPFQSTKSREQTYRKIVNIDLKFPKYLSPQIKDFISRLLIRNPRNRMSLSEALEHRWLKRYGQK